MKKLIMILGEEKFQFDTLEELTSFLLAKDEKEDYNSLTEEEKIERRYLKALINCSGQENLIINLKEALEKKQKIDFENIKKGIIIDNDYIYILSLLKDGIIILLEEKTANIFTKSIDKSKIENNYIIVNKFANELLLNYLNENIEVEK